MKQRSVRSIAKRSLGLSTTQSVASSRLVSLQIIQISVSLKLLHNRQKCSPSLSETMAWANSWADVGKLDQLFNNFFDETRVTHKRCHKVTGSHVTRKNLKHL